MFISNNCPLFHCPLFQGSMDSTFFQKMFVNMPWKINLGDTAIGSRRDNPSVKGVGYHDNIIKSQYSVRPIDERCGLP